MTTYADRNKYTRAICLRLPNDLAAKVEAYRRKGGPTISPLVQGLIREFFDGTEPGWGGELPTQSEIDKAAIDLAAKRTQSKA
jgi:hypothetical protein